MACHTERFYAPSIWLEQRLGADEPTLLHCYCAWRFFRRETVYWMGHRRSWTDNLLGHHGGCRPDSSLRT